MSIRFISASKTMLTFETNMDMSQFNVFRKIILSEVPVIAIDLIQFIENDTVMVDEILANRIASIPIVYPDQNSIKRKDLCKCTTVCNDCSFLIEFKGVEIEENRWLMSEDISPFLLKNIPVINLIKGQKLEFNLICTKSNAIEHAKWSPGIVCNFRKMETSIIVTLINTGPHNFGYILKQTFTIMKFKGIEVSIS